MKNQILIVTASLAIGLASTNAQAHEASYYSSKRMTVAATQDVSAMTVGDHSTRTALLAHRAVSAAEPQPAALAFYNTKAAFRGERATEIELALLK